MYREEFAKNIKARIGKRSVLRVAEEIGITKQALTNCISCQGQIRFDTLIKIANYFDEDLDFLTGRKE